VCPGEHQIAGVSHRVVWWSPESQVLSLNVQPPFGLRRDDLIVKDVDPDVLRKGLDAHKTWETSRTADISVASRASMDVISATTAASTLELTGVDLVPATVVENASQTARPGGPRFGSLVHALLADVPLGDESTAVLERLSEAHGRILGATNEEVQTAREVVQAVLAHPVLQAAGRAARRGQCYRETPVTYRLDSGTLVEGYVDLAFQDGGSFVVVDFKTDRELDGSLERYQRQVSLYATAVTQSAGLPAQAFLMRL
jgi:ATP-dependent exoDNAse (exonuclease V) beta subunit